MRLTLATQQDPVSKPKPTNKNRAAFISSQIIQLLLLSNTVLRKHTERWREKAKGRRQAELRLQASGRVLLSRYEALVLSPELKACRQRERDKETRDGVFLNTACRSC